MKLQSIQAFLATVETGSIRAAARALELSQPAISKTLKTLEDELGAPLLTRGSKGIDLTEYGHAFFIRANTIWNESTRARDEIRQMRGERDGHVSIAFAPAATFKMAPVAIRNFRHQYPKVKVHVLEGLDRFAVGKLRTGEIDMAVSPMHTGMSDKEFVIEPLIDIHFKVVARKDHPLKDAKSLQELSTADWILVGAQGSLNPLIINTYEAYNLDLPEFPIEYSSLTGSLLIIRHSDAVGLAPEDWTMMPGFSESLTTIQVAETLQANRLYLIYRRDRPLTPVAQHMATQLLRLAEVS